MTIDRNNPAFNPAAEDYQTRGASVPIDYEQRLRAQRTPAPPVPTETAADREGRERTQRAMAAERARAPAPTPSSEYLHTSTERFGNRIVVKRSRRSGEVVATHEVAIPPAPPVEPFTPSGFAEGPRGRRANLPYEERLRRVRAGQP